MAEATELELGTMVSRHQVLRSSSLLCCYFHGRALHREVGLACMLGQHRRCKRNLKIGSWRRNEFW